MSGPWTVEQIEGRVSSLDEASTFLNECVDIKPATEGARSLLTRYTKALFRHAGGGRCSVCKLRPSSLLDEGRGANQYVVGRSSLEFHHPRRKGFEVGGYKHVINGERRVAKIAKYTAEARRCVLLCKSCHCRLHR